MAKEYRIQIEDDIITPEETLLDSGSEFSDIERPIRPTVFRGIFWGVAIFLGLIFAASAHLGLAQYDYYSNLAFQNRSANFTLPPARGIIFDKSGESLVKNIPQFDVIGVSKEVRSALKSNSIDLAQLSKTLSLKAEDLKSLLSSKAQEANIFFLATDLTKEQVLAIQALSPPGIYVIPDVQRVYIDGPQFSTVLGYVGKVNKDDLARDDYYGATDSIGRLGIESKYETTLRGEHGRIFFGDTTNTINTAAQTGHNVVLNLDANLQRQVYDQLRNVLAGAGLSRGAAIIQNPQTGAVLAMVSFPGFDNNLFTKGLSQAQYDAIFNNPARPLFNRVVSGLYNPGSTIKPLMGLAALQEKVVTPNTTIQDCISISIPNPYDKSVVYTYRNWREDYGAFDLRRAIAQSCDVYFYTVGGGYGNISGLGAERIDKYLTASLADKTLGIDLVGESHGFVPTPDWKEKTRGEPWYQGDSYNISIGQGDLSVTPLWLNSYISAIANGGTMYQPQMVNRIVDMNKNPVQIITPQSLEKLPFSDANLNEIKNDMRETVLSGTASVLKDLPVSAGAKTGTAEVVKGQSINSLFTVFAPFDHPQISMTVLVEGSHSNQGLAIRTANEVLKWYFSQTASASN
jgi:penicillin-binding protein 2